MQYVALQIVANAANRCELLHTAMAGLNNLSHTLVMEKAGRFA